MLKITTVSGFSFTEKGSYTFANGCYYINGNSYPKEIVTVIE